MDDLISTLDSMFAKWTKESTLNMPKVKAAKKKKFLISIGAADELEKLTDVSIEDEKLPLGFNFLKRTVNGTTFDDSIVIKDFEIIKKPDFDLETYVSCVKNLYNNPYFDSKCMCYLLCHARDFNKPQKNLLKFSEQGHQEILPSIDKSVSILTHSRFTTKLLELMDDLLTQYDELKYQQLNLNVTYLVLLMARKFKSESSFVNALNNPKTNQDYFRLCPKALGEALPTDPSLLKNKTQSHGQIMNLILYAYYTSSRLSKRILLTTCLAHLEFTGLGLPKMFDQIVKLYNVPEVRLWNLLCMKDKEDAMFLLADFHYSQYKGEQETPSKTYILFPYCRVLSQNYHADLSCSIDHNKVICYAMACLIDRKIGYDKSFVRNSKWIETMLEHPRRMGESIADTIYNTITGNSTL